MDFLRHRMRCSRTAGAALVAAATLGCQVVIGLTERSAGGGMASDNAGGGGTTSDSAGGSSSTAGSKAEIGGAPAMAGSSSGLGGDGGSSGVPTAGSGGSSSLGMSGGGGGGSGGSSGGGGSNGGSSGGGGGTVPTCASTTATSPAMTADAFCKILLATCTGKLVVDYMTQAECVAHYGASSRQMCQSYHVCNAVNTKDTTTHCPHAQQVGVVCGN
jgi:hypothetical protein